MSRREKDREMGGVSRGTVILQWLKRWIRWRKRSVGGRRRGEGVTNEVRGTSERNEVEIGRWGGEERKMSGGQRVYYLSIIVWIGKHTHAHTLRQSSRTPVPLAIISSSINCIITDPSRSTHVCYCLRWCRCAHIFEAWVKIRYCVQLISAYL